jgi:hypothetical protein
MPSGFPCVQRRKCEFYHSKDRPDVQICRLASHCKSTGRVHESQPQLADAAEPAHDLQVSRRSGVPASAWLEDRRLIAPEWAGSGHRRYPRAVLWRMHSSCSRNASISRSVKFRRSWRSCRRIVCRKGRTGRNFRAAGHAAHRRPDSRNRAAPCPSQAM